MIVCELLLPLITTNTLSKSLMIVAIVTWRCGLVQCAVHYVPNGIIITPVDV